MLSEVVDVFTKFFSVSELEQIFNGARNAIFVAARDVEDYFENDLEFSSLVTQLKAYSSLIILRVQEHINNLKELEHSNGINLEIDSATYTKRPNVSVNQLRPFGLCTGEFIVPDDFDAPLPEEILSAFE